MSDKSNTVPVVEKRPRLKFIDMARSVAILLMLEGHFIHDSLEVSGIVNGMEVPDIYAGYPLYEIWKFIRGFTSPTFLTVTGLVFVYLLLMNRDEPYTKNERIKKGFTRVIELLFWGYLLQPYAFHVLQCIGIGIGMILLIFGLYKLVKKVPLWIYFVVAGMLIFFFGMELQQMRTVEGVQAWPANAPKFIQNIFLAPPDRSLFPIFPHMGFTMIGAAIGCWLHDFQKYVKTWGFAFAFVAIGSVFFFATDHILTAVDSVVSTLFGEMRFKNITMNWIMYKVGMVFIVLGLLMIIEKLLGDIKQNLFLKIGQNTLSVYIVHMIVLYGAITGFGLTNLFHDTLTPYEAVLGAILFICAHLVFTYYIDPLRSFYNKVLEAVLPWKRSKSKPVI